MKVRTASARISSLLVRREWTSAQTWLAAPVLLVLAALAGWAAPPPGVEADPYSALGANVAGRFQGSAPAIIAFVAAVTVVTRLVGDHRSAWIAPLFAAGLARPRYVGVVLGAVLSVWLPLLVLTVAIYGLAAHATGGAEWGALAGKAVGGGALVVSVSVFGAALALLWRSARGAIFTGVALYVAPIASVMTYVIQTRSEPNRMLFALTILYLPPMTDAVTAVAILWHVAYSSFLLAFVLWSSERFLARYR